MVSTTTAPSAVKPAAATPAALYLKEEVQVAIEGIISYLTPTSELHRCVAEAFAEGDYRKVKRLASTNLSDTFSKAYMYLCSAPKLTPGTDNILAESARAAALHCRQIFIRELGQNVVAETRDSRQATQIVFSALKGISTSNTNETFRQAANLYQEDGDTEQLTRLVLSGLDEPFLQAVRALTFVQGAFTKQDPHLSQAIGFAADAKELEVLEDLSKVIENALKHL